MKCWRGIILSLVNIGLMLGVIALPIMVSAQSGTPLENFLRRTLPLRPADPGKTGVPLFPEALEQAFPSSYPVLIIDPGHGGTESGGKGVSGLQEKEVTLRLAQQIAEQMRGILPLTPRLTRETDTLLTAEQRVSFANSQQGILFISLHTGGAVTASAPVHRVYVYGLPGEQRDGSGAPPLGLVPWNQAHYPYHYASLQLGEKVRTALAQTLGETVYLQADMPLLLLEGLQMPAILIEIGQLAPAEAEKRLADPIYGSQITQGIIEGIRQYTALIF
jgi:N-acetylmuramoyl-L-alanine amidase